MRAPITEIPLFVLKISFARWRSVERRGGFHMPAIVIDFLLFLGIATSTTGFVVAVARLLL
jgi:hypothetical protein